MKVSDLHYELPNELLAREPREVRGEKRSDSRLLVMDRKTNTITHTRFYNILDYMSSGDVIVLNNSKTINAHLIGWFEEKKKVDVHLCGRTDSGHWQFYIYPDKGLFEGGKVNFNDKLTATLVKKHNELKYFWLAEFDQSNVIEIANEIGRPIVSPYIKKFWKLDYYQNEYASISGSAELPAAGRHFTEELLDQAERKGITITYITLHTGLSSVGVSTEEFENHKMHHEEIEISEETSRIINKARSEGKRVFGIGTTVVRTLESVADENGIVKPFKGGTDLYIFPGYKFKVIDAFVTNFHGAKSTRIAMAAAFTGSDLLMKGYSGAIEKGYLFYEFGDTTLTI